MIPIFQADYEQKNFYACQSLIDLTTDINLVALCLEQTGYFTLINHPLLQIQGGLCYCTSLVEFG